jgi:lysophospholipase L1-like esterase
MPPSVSRWQAAVLVAAAAGAVGLGACSSPSGPTPVALAISCPVVQPLETVDGSPVPVTFTDPETTGGTAPVTTTCTPVSGSLFGLGATTVSCSARDARNQTAACNFAVNVSRVPELTATRFLAFGDSITDGALSPCPILPAWGGRRSRPGDLNDIWLIRSSVSPPTSYPSVLHGLLTARYRFQTITMVNEGLGGEQVIDEEGGTNDVTFARFRSALNAHVPQVVLLQEGVNDLNNSGGHLEVIAPIVKALRDLAREARGRGIHVMIGTLLPQEPGSCRAFAPAMIVPANDAIKEMVTAEGYTLVDLHQSFNGIAGPLIGVDGLHPNEMGYQKIAEAFLASIRQNLQVK